MEKKFEIIVLSVLLMMIMVEMKYVINVFKEVGIRDVVKVIVGGVLVIWNFVDEIGVDGYVYDLFGVVQLCKELV